MFVEVYVEIDDRIVDDRIVDVGYVIGDRSVVLMMGSVALLLRSIATIGVCGHSLGSGTRSSVS